MTLISGPRNPVDSLSCGVLGLGWGMDIMGIISWAGGGIHCRGLAIRSAVAEIRFAGCRRRVYQSRMNAWVRGGSRRRLMVGWRNYRGGWWLRSLGDSEVGSRQSLYKSA